MKRSRWFVLGLALALFTLPAMFRQDEGGGSIRISQDNSSIELEFEAGDGVSLLDLLVVAQNRAGQPLHYSNSEVKDVRIDGIGRQTVDAAHFTEFFEATLHALDFVVIEKGGALWIRKSGGASTAAKPGYIKTEARFVPADQIPSWKNRYRVITTSFALQHANAQEVMNMLQSYFADPLVESVRGVSATNSLVITGYGNTLATIAELIAVIDRDGAERLPPVQLTKLTERVEALEASVARLQGK